MKDCQGKELYVGDSVAFYSFVQNRLYTGKIVGFTTNYREEKYYLADILCDERIVHIYSWHIFKYAEQLFCANCLNYDKCAECYGCESKFAGRPSNWLSDGTDDSYREVVSEYL